MWRTLFKQGSKLLSWTWKGLKGGGKLLLKPFSSVLSGRTGSVLRSVWKVVDYGLTGWFIYDIFWGDDENSADAAHAMIYEALLSESICTALSVPINDSRVVCNAFAAQGVKYVDDEISMMTLRGMGYLGAAAYLNEYPYGRLKFSAPQIKEILMNEAVGFFTQFGGVSEEDTSQLTSAFEDIDWEDMSMEQLRRFDFMCYVISDLAEFAEDTQNIGRGEGVAPAGNFAIQPTQN